MVKLIRVHKGVAMPIVAQDLQRAVRLYLDRAYPDGPFPSAAVQAKIAQIMALPADPIVPLDLFNKDPANLSPSYALQLGQPMYPFMKLVVDPAPPPLGQDPQSLQSYLLRVDAHDQHLHTPPESPDAAWLAAVRASNQELVEKIEADWAKAGLPTFKEYLRKQLAARRAKKEGGETR